MVRMSIYTLQNISRFVSGWHNLSKTHHTNTPPSTHRPTTNNILAWSDGKSAAMQQHQQER